MGKIKCTHCGSTDVRPSSQEMVSKRFVVYRCRACKDHFKVRVGPRLSTPVLISLALLLTLLAAWAAILLLEDPIDQLKTTGTQSALQR